MNNSPTHHQRLTQTILAVALSIITTCIGSKAQQAKPQADTAKTGSISGRVVNESGQPLIGATVFVRNATVSSTSRTTTSNAEGNFQVNGLDNGLYYVSANSPAYVTQPTDVDNPLPVYRVGDTLRLELIRGGIITGSVTNTTGDPIVGVRVRAFMVRDATGKPTKGAVFSFGESATDDRGIYRMYGLAPGTFLVQAGGGGTSMGTSSSGTELDAPTYAPSSTRDSASEIQVRSGEEATVDIRYRGDPGHSISGTVKVQGANGASIMLSQTGDGVLPTAGSYQPPGARGFAISGLADGEYSITAQEVVSQVSSGYPEIAISEPVHITIKGADITGLELIPRPLASIAGRIILEPSPLPECQNKRQPLLSETMVSLVQNRKNPSPDQLGLLRLFVGTSSPDKEGAFLVRNVRQGQYSFSPRFFARYWYLKSMLIGSGNQTGPSTRGPATLPKDAAKTWTAVRPGDRVTGLMITLAEGAGSIRGRIEPKEGTKLESGLRVYLSPSERDRAEDPMRYFTTIVGDDGTFTLTNLPPGKYWALTQGLQPDVPDSTEKLRLPDAFEMRTRIRRAAESAKTEVELKPCQNLIDYKLPSN